VCLLLCEVRCRVYCVILIVERCSDRAGEKTDGNNTQARCVMTGPCWTVMPARRIFTFRPTARPPTGEEAEPIWFLAHALPPARPPAARPST
jgi:hypothetical protein